MVAQLLIVIAICLVGAWIELFRVRRLLAEEAQARRQEEADEPLRKLCPNLFWRGKAVMREWYANGMPDRTAQVRRFMDAANEADKAWLGQLCDLTNRFLKEAASSTVLTEEEAEFIASREWTSISPPIHDAGPALLANHRLNFDECIKRYKRKDLALSTIA